jgi:hypothetical protein
MFWLRSRMRIGSWSALLALIIQLVLSFGYLHLDGIHPRPGAAPLARQWTAPAKFLVAPTDPAQQSPADLADDFCAMCSIARLAGVPAAAPVLPVPTRTRHIEFDLRVDLAWTAASERFFHARAPPMA